MASDKMVVAPPAPSAEMTAWDAMEAKVRRLIQSGYLRRWTTYKKGENTITKPEQQSVVDVMFALMTARELGIPDGFMLRHGYVTPNGDVSLDSHILMALYRSRGGLFEVTKEEDDEAVVRFYDEEGHEYISRFSVTDAKRAGLIRGDYSAWVKQPRNQCLRQAFARGARTFRPDLMAGMYAHDELGITFSPEAPVVELTEEEGQAIPQDIGDVTEAEFEEAEEYQNEEEAVACVTEADLEEFKGWCNDLSANLSVDVLLIRKAGHNFLAKMHKTMKTLTPQELTVLMQDLQTFDYSSLGGE